jgi:iron complex outermembrane receptor protein
MSELTKTRSTCSESKLVGIGPLVHLGSVIAAAAWMVVINLQAAAQTTSSAISEPASEDVAANQLPSVPAPRPATAEAGTAEVERVIVTGSNIPTAEEVGPNPVDTYRREDIQKLGVRTATDLTQRIPAITGGGINENIANGGDGRTEINLRGLFPKETLVLVDGKRVAPVGFAQDASVDLNLIPWPLVDHIDILKDGASAIYGSDAVAGVFNIFLKHKFRGLEIEASLGNTNLGSSNDAAEREGYLLAGLGDDKTDIVVFAEYYDRAPLFSRDRDLSSTADFTRFGGTDNRNLARAGGVGRFFLRPGLTTPTPHSAPNAGTSPDYVPLLSLPSADVEFDFAPLTSAIPAADRQYYYGSFVRDLCDKYLTVFADFKVVRTFFDANLAPVPFAPDPFKRADGVTAVSPNGISVPLSNPFNPFTEPDDFLPDGTPVTTRVRYRALEAGPRTIKTTTFDYLFDGGFRGNLGEFGDYFKTWNFEIGFRYNSNDHSLIISGIVSKPELRSALLDTNPLTAFNPFGRNVNTQAAINRVFVSTQERGVATLTDESALLNGDIISTPAGPLSFALGTEHRKETVNDQPDPLNTTFNSIGGADLEATRESRDVWSYYGELRIPVTSSGWNFPGIHSLEFQAAERVEFYSDTNLAERPKFSLRYQPFDSSLTLRASYSEAFHAPNLSDLAPSAAEQFSFLFDPANPPPPDMAPPLVRILLGGQPNLRPEVAYGWNYGAVWTPRFIRGLTLSVDFYHIDLRDRTNFIDPQFVVTQNFLSGGRRFPGQVVRDADGNIILVRDLIQNISRTITEGIDYEAIYVFDTTILGAGSFGTFTFTLNGNYLSRYVAAINLGDRELEYAGQETGFGGYFPHNKLYASAYYDLGGLDAGVTVHYIGQGGETFINNKDATAFRKIREWTTVDAIVSYTFNLAAPATENQVAGYAKDGNTAVKMKDGKDKNLMPISTAQYSSCGWRAWLNGTTITAGMNNIFDLDPPFAASASENGYVESTFDIKGRFWYVSLKKKF